jgi:L-methionine (R)-S-oxide reductase
MLDASLTDWLQQLLTRHAAIAGTLHLRCGDVLELVAAVNIPAVVQQITAQIPKGKGMAGLAWQDDRAVQTCNLKEDTSGAVKPGAKAVDAAAAVALPIHGPEGVRGVLGMAWMHARELTPDEVATIAADAERLP